MEKLIKEIEEHLANIGFISKQNFVQGNFAVFYVYDRSEEINTEIVAYMNLEESTYSLYAKI